MNNQEWKKGQDTARWWVRHKTYNKLFIEVNIVSDNVEDYSIYTCVGDQIWGQIHILG